MRTIQPPQRGSISLVPRTGVGGGSVELPTCVCACALARVPAARPRDRGMCRLGGVVAPSAGCAVGRQGRTSGGVWQGRRGVTIASAWCIRYMFIVYCILTGRRGVTIASARYIRYMFIVYCILTGRRGVMIAGAWCIRYMFIVYWILTGRRGVACGRVDERATPAAVRASRVQLASRATILWIPCIIYVL